MHARTYFSVRRPLRLVRPAYLPCLLAHYGTVYTTPALVASRRARPRGWNDTCSCHGVTDGSYRGTPHRRHRRLRAAATAAAIRFQGWRVRRAPAVICLQEERTAHDRRTQPEFEECRALLRWLREATAAAAAAPTKNRVPPEQNTRAPYLVPLLPRSVRAIACVCANVRDCVCLHGAHVCLSAGWADL